MIAGDELIVDVNDDAPWGHKARNRMMQRAKGDFICFQDDDDIYLPGAFERIRAGTERDFNRVHIFRMEYFGQILWTEPVVREGNVSTQMFVVPNEPKKLGAWGTVYESDFYFLRDTVKLLGDPVWHEDLIAHYRVA